MVTKTMLPIDVQNLMETIFIKTYQDRNISDATEKITFHPECVLIIPAIRRSMEFATVCLRGKP